MMALRTGLLLAGSAIVVLLLPAQSTAGSPEFESTPESMVDTARMEEKGKYFIKNYEVAHMASYSNYPQTLLDAMQVRGLIAPRGAEIQDDDVSVSVIQLDPGTHYGDHAHPFPEIYIFISGTADANWGDETFSVSPGTVTHCPPNVPHALKVTSAEPLRAVIVNWAPNGDRSVWKTPSKMLDPETE